MTKPYILFDSEGLNTVTIQCKMPSKIAEDPDFSKHVECMLNAGGLDVRDFEVVLNHKADWLERYIDDPKRGYNIPSLKRELGDMLEALGDKKLKPAQLTVVKKRARKLVKVAELVLKDDTLLPIYLIGERDLIADQASQIQQILQEVG